MKVKVKLSILVSPLTLCGWSLQVATGLHAGEETRASDIRFTDVTASSGVNLNMTCGRMPSTQILEVNGGGVAFFDFDNDADLDMFIANGATMDDPERGPGSRLFANRGDGNFDDVTAEAGIELRRWAMGVAVGDYDLDGWDDLYVTCYGPNVLLRNVPQEDATRKVSRKFVDTTTVAGVGDPLWGTSAAFGDIDGDNDLDLYVVNYLEFDARRPPAPHSKSFFGVPVMAGPSGMPAQEDVLYENLGNGKFRDISKESGCVPTKDGYGLGVIIVDVDSDGRQDIFVGNDSTPNFLFHNQGNKKFQDIGVTSGICCNADGAGQATMGIAVGDMDGNGLPDFFTTNFSSDTNTLHLNLGKPGFDDRTSQFGLGVVSRPFLGWGAGFFDFDGDGDEDLFIANGHVYPETATHKLDTEYEQVPLLFERVGPRFERRVDAGGMFTARYRGRACAFGDLDNDGDVDVVMTTLNGPVHVFRNDSARRSVVVVELKGNPGNPRGLGAMIELHAEGTTQRRWILGGGYQQVNAPLAYLGLGTSVPSTVTLSVTWPGGRRREYRGCPTNRRLILTEDDGTFRDAPLTGRGP